MPFKFDLSDSALATYGFAGGLISTFFLAPKKLLWGLTGLYLAGGAFAYFMRSRWVESASNEWLLIIRDGKLLRGGIGLKTFIGLTDSHVTFESKIERVEFKANNVTKEMQGVIISGVAFWSVNR